MTVKKELLRAMQDLPVFITRSKVYPPPMATDTVKRERLLSLAQSAVQIPLTLVSAPAGCSKSTLVSQWLETIGCISAWLSLGAEDSDLTQFLSYGVAALRGAGTLKSAPVSKLMTIR